MGAPHDGISRYLCFLNIREGGGQGGIGGDPGSNPEVARRELFLTVDIHAKLIASGSICGETIDGKTSSGAKP